MKTSEIRQRFLDHFARNGHTVVPSASLIADDPNLLFVNAGMVPFKPYFLGQLPPPYPRATSVQKCVRTLDIDEVGKTTRHLSFFQMNGNFSFGDYFKQRAVELAWDLVTKPVADGGYGLDPERLWATVYLDDDEAAGIWRDTIGLPTSRVVRLGKAANFWSMGVPGPCGPCSEILFDRGPEFGPEYDPERDDEPDGDRYLEFWNLVFMQYERGPGTGKDDFEILGDLPAKSIDTGMGLERMAQLLQGVENLYEIDEVFPVLERAAALAGKRYGQGSDEDSHADDVRLRVVADHVRTALMLIADGVTPSNEGRGYVLRRILRRAVRAMRLLGYEGRSFPELFPVAGDAMSASYPEVASDFDRISSYAYAEEEAFAATLRSGTTILDTAVRETKSAGRSVLGGAQAFALHDTYGFPIDLTLEMAAEHGVTVDEDGFRRLMAEQRNRAKADARARKSGHADTSAYRVVLDGHGASLFTGYTEVERESIVTGLVGPTGVRSGAGEGEEVEVVLDVTPFYAEGGGQQADLGVLTTAGGARLEVVDVQSPLPGIVAHRARVVSGEIKAGEAVFAQIDIGRRRSVSRSHSATHLVHAGLRRALGDSAAQAGSLNAPGRLRFDFSAHGAVPPSVLADVEDEVNETLIEDLEVRAFVTSQEEAKRIGALAMFGEKYGEEVRVVEIGDYSRELCGGTHVARSAHIGMVKLLAESSIGSGVRRVEALVGLDAFRFLAREHVLVSQLAEQFKARPDEVPDRVAAVLGQLRDAERELEKLRAAAVLSGASEQAAKAEDVSGVAVVAVEAPEGTSGNDVRGLVQEIRGRLDAGRPGVVAVVARAGGKATLVVAVNRTARDAGQSASTLVKGALSGRGGGNEDLAQGGGVPAAQASELLDAVTRLVARTVSGAA